MRWAGRVAYMEEMKTSYKILAIKSEGKNHLENLDVDGRRSLTPEFRYLTTLSDRYESQGSSLLTYSVFSLSNYFPEHCLQTPAIYAPPSKKDTTPHTHTKQTAKLFCTS
jgi:hypothetical protein